MHAGAPTPQSLRLADGRVLSWYEFGDPSGTPCLYMPGTPESGLAGSCYDRSAAGAGVRWLSIDKPGYGRSDPRPRRRLLDWPSDVAELADHLVLERFAVAGESGGGAHALAVAYARPERVAVTILLAPMGPGHEAWVRKGMRRSNVVFFSLARYFPTGLRIPLAVMRRVTASPRLRARLEAAEPEADRASAADPESALRKGAVEDAFRFGTRPAAEELRLFALPWGFELADVPGPVHLWHGTADINVPVAVARGMADALPDVVTHFVEDAGHTVGFAERHAVMAAVIGAFPRATDA